MRKAFFFSICLEDPVRHGRAKPSCRQIESSTRSILFPRENERKSPLELSGTCLNNPSYHCLHINGPALPALFLIYSAIDTAGPSFHSFSRIFFINNSIWALFIISHYSPKTWEEGLLNVDQGVSNVANIISSSGGLSPSSSRPKSTNTWSPYYYYYTLTHLANERRSPS